MAISIGLGPAPRPLLLPNSLRRLYLVYCFRNSGRHLFRLSREADRNAALKPGLHLLSYFLIIGHLVEPSLPGFPLLGAGMLLNFLVISLNGGHMPRTLII